VPIGALDVHVGENRNSAGFGDGARVLSTEKAGAAGDHDDSTGNVEARKDGGGG
jgi:hypothetical protein